MNQLQVKTVTLEPARIEFNHEEIEKDLVANLKKYQGLTFTEDNAKECKNTIAELRKGKKAVDQYRLKIKKELTAPVTEFENKCKALNKRFDEVINPLIEQHDKFENDRKESKRKTIEELIEYCLEGKELGELYRLQIQIEDSWLTKSKSLKAIEEELLVKIDHLIMQQAKADADKEIIKSTVEVANARYNTNLVDSSYLRVLEYSDVEDVKTQILEDAQNEAISREEILKQESVAPLESITEENFIPLDEVDLVKEETTFFEVYKVTGTESQLDALEEFMRSEDITWEVLKGE